MLSEVLRTCEAVLRHRDMYYSGGLCAELQCAFEKISRSTGRPSTAVHEDALFPQDGMAGFSRVIVLDAKRAVSPAGFFDFDVFIEVIARAITEALGFDLDVRYLHREQLSQILKDERGILFCFFSLDHLTEEHYRQLRGLGFTQTDHRILFCGQSEFLRRKSTSHAESLGSESAFSPARTIQFESDDQFEANVGAEVDTAHLRVVHGGNSSRVIPIPPSGMILGRGSRLPRNRFYDEPTMSRSHARIEFDDPRMSRSHARIEFVWNEWRLMDLDSLNGSLVDGRFIDPARPASLVDGSVIRLADTIAVFRTSPEADFADLDDDSSFPGVSPSAIAVRRNLRMLVTVAGHILILGETGTGKERAARSMIPADSRRPFISQNCAELTRELVRPEIFGCMRDALSGARHDKEGLLAVAADGVLFLDEVCELPYDVQADLLRLLEGESYSPNGARTLVPSSTRIVAASKIDPDKAVASGQFRRDLLAHLRASNAPLVLPPLRERREDILPWARRFLHEAHATAPTDVWSPEAAEGLVLYDWPENLRELCEVVRALVTESRSFPINDSDLPEKITMHRKALREPERTWVDEVAHPTRATIEAVLTETQGSFARAAQLLAIPRRQLYRLCKKHGIDTDNHRHPRR